MFRSLLPSSWKMATIDVLFIILVVFVIVHLAWPTSGPGRFVSDLSRIAAEVVQLLSSWIVAFLNWL